jgi:catechol 2,3-dioxygenase-like lactoylglutathione lyase family enzyme
MTMKMRWFWTLALAVFCAFQQGAQAQGTAVTGIAHVAYRASDLEKELAFLQKLGFEESFGFPLGGKTMQAFVKVNDREFIEVYRQTDAAQPLGWMHICYESDDLKGLYELYAGRGLKLTPLKKAGAGNLLFTLQDPEDRVTEFTQYMPGSLHTLDRGKHLGGTRVATELAGVEFPVPDLAAAKQFYGAGMGFATEEGKAGLKARVTSQAYPWVQVSAAGAGNKPRLLFRVQSAAAAAHQLRVRGVAVKLGKKSASVTDPDGNILVFAEE